VVSLGSDGSENWASKLDGAGGQEAYGAHLSGLRLFVVGRQASELGSTSAVEAGFVVEYNPSTGEVVGDKSFGGATNSRFTDVVSLGSEAVAVGVIDGVAAAVRFDMNNDLAVLGHRQWTGDAVTLDRITTDDQYLYVAGTGVSGHILLTLNPDLSERWSVGSNQLQGKPSAVFGYRGLELQTTYATAGRTQAALVKLPLNGTVADIPDAVDYQWVPLTLTGADSTGVVIQDVGDWSAWETVTGVANTTTSGGAPSSTGFMPDDSLTEMFRNPQWVSNGSYERYSGWTEDPTPYHEGYQITQGSASIINPDQFGAYRLGGNNIAMYNNPTPYSGYPSSWPQDTDTAEYILETTSTPTSGWSSIGTLNMSMPKEYWTLFDAEMAMNYGDSDYGDRDVRRISSLSNITEDANNYYRSISHEARTVRMEGVVRRRTRTYYGRTYRWTGQYERATRTFVPVNLSTVAVTGLPKVALTNPTKSAVALQAYFNNF